jgi:hypothetical protein
MLRHIPGLSLLALALGAATGCVVDTGGDLQPQESIEVTESALGELGCATQQCGVATSCTPLTPVAASSCSYAYTSVTSPSATYGTAACPTAYTAWLFGVATRQFLPYIEWGDTALTSANCSSATLDLAVYVAPTGGSWSVKTSRYHGVWTGGIINTCNFLLNTGSSNPTTLDLVNRSVKLSGTAKIGSTTKRVTLGARTGRGPC